VKYLYVTEKRAVFTEPSKVVPIIFYSVGESHLLNFVKFEILGFHGDENSSCDLLLDWTPCIDPVGYQRFGGPCCLLKMWLVHDSTLCKIVRM
jgi:hypothetical protein